MPTDTPTPPPAGGAPAFPKIIPLPVVERPVTLPVAKPVEVKSAADLPSRLGFGDLVADSFRPAKKGWVAEWRDADGHFTRFRSAGGLSSLEINYAGEEAVTLTAAEQFTELGKTIESIHPGAFMAKLAERLEARANVKVFAHREDDAVSSEFPDGYRLTLVLPVPADRLMALFDLHKAMQTETETPANSEANSDANSDANIKAGIDAYVRLHFSVVNYLEGQTHPMLNHPVGLVMHHVNALGTPAAEMPAREEDEEGAGAWTLQRSHYLYIAHFYLRDAERFVDRLMRAGFIAASGQGQEGYPFAAEFGAAILPWGYEYAVQNAWWFDPARSRRMFYPNFAASEDRNGLTGSGDIWSKALIREAAKAAEWHKTDAARVFAEGMQQSGRTFVAETKLH